MSISKARGFLYTVARLLGDVQAVKRRRVGKRVARRGLGKLLGRLIRMVIK